MFETTQDFIRALETAGELVRVRARVSPVLEISEIADRVSKSPALGMPSDGVRKADPAHHALGGRALLFENVEGSDFPVLINAWGSYRRVEMALGCDAANGTGGLEALAERLGKLAKPEPPPTLLAKLQKLPELLELAKMPPKRVSSGVCQEVVSSADKVDLRRLPLLRCWPLDGDLPAVGYPADTNAGVLGLESGTEWERLHRGRYITLGTIHTIHADDLGNEHPTSRNVGMYRVQLFGKRHMAMHWHMHHDGARHWRSWKAKGQRMPVAIALGGESVLPYAATAPMPPGISELLLAGFLNRGAIPLVRCKTVPLDVPANSEIVIEGYVSNEAGLPGWEPGKGEPLGPGAVFEGPFGDHTGFYSLPDRYPILEVTAITHRRNAVYPTTIVGLPPQEDYYLGKATERVFLPLLKTIVPDIIDYDLPMFGAFHNCAFIKIRKEYPLHARRVMHAVWGAGQMSWTKCIVIVDHDVDVHDQSAVMRAIGEHCVPARDSELVRGPLDILDHAAPFLGAGGKLGLDATRKTSAAELHRSLDPLAAQLCSAGPIEPATGAEARRVEERVRQVPGVIDARVPDECGGWWLFVKHDGVTPPQPTGADGDASSCVSPTPGERVVKALGALANDVPLPCWTVLVGPGVDIGKLDTAMFHCMANVAPDRDRFVSKCGRRIAFDALPKQAGMGAHGQPVRAFPPIIEMDEATKELVTRRWGEYFP